MPTPTRFPIRAGLVLLFLAASAPMPARAQPAPITTEELMALLAAVPERRATFQEEKRLAALTEPLRSTGHMLYRRPDHLEKITDWPQPERLVVDSGRLVLTTGNEPPRVVDLGGQPELRAMVDAMRGPLAGDLAALRRAFAVQVSGTRAAWRMELRPTDPRAARVLRLVEVAGRNADPTDIHVVQANGDEGRILIEPEP